MGSHIRLVLLCLLALPAGYRAYAEGDSTRKGLGKARISIFFKRNFDIRNNGAARKYRKDEEKSTTRLAFPFDSDGYQLVFADEFDSLNRATWQNGQPWGRFHKQFPHQYYGDSEVFVNNGMLHLQNRLAPRDIRDGDSTYHSLYATGIVNSCFSQTFTYGYFAIRSKNPKGPATWPAFWLTGRYHWPPEIDIFEMYGQCSGNGIHKQTMSVHFGRVEDHTKTLLVKSVQLPEDTDTAFHIYSCLWEPGLITFFTDGVKLKEIQLTAWMEQFYREPMYIILNNAVDHRHLDCIRPGDMPNTFQVDWVRVYQKKN